MQISDKSTRFVGSGGKPIEGISTELSDPS